MAVSSSRLGRSMPSVSSERISDFTSCPRTGVVVSAATTAGSLRCSAGTHVTAARSASVTTASPRSGPRPGSPSHDAATSSASSDPSSSAEAAGDSLCVTSATSCCRSSSGMTTAAGPRASARRSANVRNSRKSKSRLTSVGLGSIFSDSGSSIGASRRRIITAWFLRTRSSCSASEARSFGVSSSRCMKIPSSPPYVEISLAAVFSPTPGTPGRLSLGSPRSAAYSGYWAGVTPVRSKMPASS